MEVDIDLDPLDFSPPEINIIFTLTASIRVQLPAGWPFISREYLLKQTQAGTPWLTSRGAFTLTVKSSHGIKPMDILSLVQSSSIWDYIELDLEPTDNPSCFNVRTESAASPSILPLTRPLGIFCSLSLAFHISSRSLEYEPAKRQQRHTSRRRTRLDTERKKFFATNLAKLWVDSALYTLIGTQKQPVKASVPLGEIAPVLFNPRYQEAMAQRVSLIPRLVTILAEPSLYEGSARPGELNGQHEHKILAYSGIWRLIHQHATPQWRRVPMMDSTPERSPDKRQTVARSPICPQPQGVGKLAQNKANITPENTKMCTRHSRIRGLKGDSNGALQQGQTKNLRRSPRFSTARGTVQDADSDRQA